MIFNKKNKCDQVNDDLSRITALVNGRLHMFDLHRKIDIFFYIDRTIQIRELCERLKRQNDADVDAQLTELHNQVMERWKTDKVILSPEPNIVL